MQLTKFFKTIPIEATVFSFFSLTLLLLKVFWFNRFTEFFSLAYETGQIVESLLLSIVSGYVFYVVVNHTKELRDKRAIAPFIIKQTRIIVIQCNVQLREFENKTSIELTRHNLSKGSLREAFSKINPQCADAPLVIDQQGNRANWFNFFEHHNYRTSKAIIRLFNHVNYVPVEIISIVASIEDCGHFVVIQATKQLATNNQDLSAWTDTFYEYYLLCQKLSEELDRYESLYSISPRTKI